MALPRLEHHPGRADQRVAEEPVGHVRVEAELDGPVDEYLREEIDICGARAVERDDLVHLVRGNLLDAARRRKDRLDERELLFGGGCDPAHRRGAAADEQRRVGHDPHDLCVAAERLLDEFRADARRDRDEHRFGARMAFDFGQHIRKVLRLYRQHDIVAAVHKRRRARRHLEPARRVVFPLAFADVVDGDLRRCEHPRAGDAVDDGAGHVACADKSDLAVHRRSSPLKASPL